MTYAFARIGTVVAIKVEDYYPAGKRGWARLHVKGGKRHEMPAPASWSISSAIISPRRGPPRRQRRPLPLGG
jgi:hypothetical protein